MRVGGRNTQQLIEWAYRALRNVYGNMEGKLGMCSLAKGQCPGPKATLLPWIKLSQFSDFWVLKKSCPLKTEFERYLLKDPKINEGRNKKGVVGMDVSNEENRCDHMIIGSSNTATFSLLSR